MFGPNAPIWSFLERCGGAADPDGPETATRVFETYPVLAMIALNWILPGSRPAGRLPKCNPDRRRTFSSEDWQHVCRCAHDAFRGRGLGAVETWINDAYQLQSPGKAAQDCLDACLCLLVALQLAEHRDCLVIGDTRTGYMVVPANGGLQAELETRCVTTGREPSDWMRTYRLSNGSQGLSSG